MMKPPEIEIPEDDPFRNDVLSRKETIEKLTNFLKNQNEPFVFGLNSEWGTGKTTFVRLWRQHLRNGKFNTLYFNAWKTDFSGDPFIALVEELRREIEDSGGADSARRDKIARRLRDTSIVLAKKGIPLLLRIATKGYLNLDEKTEDEISQLVSELARERIDGYLEKRDGIEAFRTALAEAVKGLAKDGVEALPLVIFIDELDRCRPTYAIELLENAKHLFSVPGVVFVISVARDQLAKSIGAVYGQGFDAEGYLRRFFDLDFRLPGPPTDEFVDFLFEKLGLFEELDRRKSRQTGENPADLLDFFRSVLPQLRLGLRVQIQILARLKCVLAQISPDQRIFPRSIGLLAILRVWNPGLFDGFASGQTDPSDVIDFLEIASQGELFRDRYGRFLEGYILAMGAEVGPPSDRVRKYTEIIENQANDDSQTAVRQKEAVAVFRDVVKSANWEENPTFFQKTVNRIEMV